MRYEHNGGAIDRMHLKVEEIGHQTHRHLVHAAGVDQKARQGRCAESYSQQSTRSSLHI